MVVRGGGGSGDRNAGVMCVRERFKDTDPGLDLYTIILRFCTHISSIQSVFVEYQGYINCTSVHNCTPPTPFFSMVRVMHLRFEFKRAIVTQSGTFTRILALYAP